VRVAGLAEHLLVRAVRRTDDDDDALVALSTRISSATWWGWASIWAAMSPVSIPSVVSLPAGGLVFFGSPGAMPSWTEPPRGLIRDCRVLGLPQE